MRAGGVAGMLRSTIAGCTVVIAVAALSHVGPSAQQRVEPGDPLPGMTPAEFEEFRLGLDDFLEVETAEEGLGPAYNATSCAGCHSIPAIGGIAPVTTVRAGIRDTNGAFRDFDPARGSLFQLFSIPTHGCQSVIPPEANVISRRVPIPLFGAGLIEAISDTTILALADPNDADGDGVSGRAALITDRASGDVRVGRFGWKAQIATLLEFGGDAYRNEMGITNDLFPEELTFNLTDMQLRVCDPIPEPEDIPELGTGRRGIDNFEAFMKFLAPLPRGPMTAQVTAGEEIFRSIGCSACHVPTLTTGPDLNPLFDQRPVPLFSDLLLHDIGTGDGIRQASGEPEELRTPALWGLRFRRPLLHDGSAATVPEAVLRHANEADSAIARLSALSSGDAAALIAFLNSL
ncbi:MAG: di-heme oxidoredictase family protein [Vicinamibacterales bacterium]